MEILLALLYPAGFVSIVTGLIIYLRKQEISQRAIKIAKAHLTPAEDIEVGFKAVADSVKALRAAKEEEDQLHIDAWEQEFYSPEEYKAVLAERKHQKELEEHKVSTKFIPATQTNTVSAVGWKRHTEKPDEELSYSQRRIQSAGGFVRSAPSTKASTYGALRGGSVFRVEGYVRGEPVAGNDIWFFYIGKDSKVPMYIHSIATTNRSTSGIPDCTEYDTTTIMNAAGEVALVEQTPSRFVHATGIEYASHIQMPVAEVARRVEEESKWKSRAEYIL